MDLYSQMFTRASVTKFYSSEIPEETLAKIEQFIPTVKPLIPDVKLSHKILPHDAVKGLMLPNAPNFLIISGEQHPLRGVCAGFLYQHVELYMYSMGLATRWLSSVKAKEADPNHVCGFAFGKPADPEQAKRKHEDFKRKPLNEIAKGEDSRFEAVRLAPSGMNGQPWYFVADGDAIHVYYKLSLGGLAGKMYHLTDLDLGLALCHLAVASDHEGKSFNFVTGRTDVPAPPKGFAYVGTVEG